MSWAQRKTNVSWTKNLYWGREDETWYCVCTKWNSDCRYCMKLDENKKIFFEAKLFCEYKLSCFDLRYAILFFFFFNCVEVTRPGPDSKNSWFVPQAHHHIFLTSALFGKRQPSVGNDWQEWQNLWLILGTEITLVCSPQQCLHFFYRFTCSSFYRN